MMSLYLVAWVGGGLITVFVVFAAVMNWIHSRRLRSHTGMTRSEFTTLYANDGIGADISGAVYDQFESLSGVSGFEPHPDDGFTDVYVCDDEDVYDELLELLQRLGGPDDATTEGVFGTPWPGPRGTLDEAVRWIDLVIKNARDGAPREIDVRSEPLGLNDGKFRLH